MNQSVDQADGPNQSASTERRSSARLTSAIRAIPVGVCGWGPKVLLEHLHSLAEASGQRDLLATTQPQLADALGCTDLTAGEFLDALVRLGLVTIERRLYRREYDERAPNLRDGGTILRLNRERVFRLAADNRGPVGTRYRPASEAAVSQAAERQRALEEELRALRDAHGQLGVRLAEVLAEILAVRNGLHARRRRRPSAPYERCAPRAARAAVANTNGTLLAASSARRAA